MKIDTHTHVLLTKESPFDWKAVKFHFDIAKAQGLDVVCLTEHMDALHFNELYQGLFLENCFEAVEREDGTIQLPNSLIIAAGTEIPLKGGGEVGLYTTMKALNSLNKENGYYTLDSLVDKLINISEDYVLVGNHLCNPDKWIVGIEQKADSLDAIEILPKHSHLRNRYEELSNSLRKPLIAGSDSHTWIQFGLGYTNLDIAEFSLRNLKQAVIDNKFTISIHPDSEKMTHISEMYRKHLRSSEQ